MDASIWDEPVVHDASKRTERDTGDRDEEEDILHRPTKRPRQSLFYADSDDDLESGPSNATVLKAPPAQEIDIDALFEGLDDEETNSRPLPAIVNEEELTRQAEARYKKNASPLLTPHEILPSSSPSRDASGKAGGKGREKAKEGDEKKARKRQLRLDENLLLSPTGFPQLMKMTKDFTIKGKGHEATDLDRLLRIYQYWTHQLYPKTTFSDTVERIEKLCHSRRMHVALSVWRDEAHGKVGEHIDIEDSDDGENPKENDNDQGMGVDNQNSGLPSSSPPRSSPRSSSPPPNNLQRPQAAPSSTTLEDDPEFWKMLEAGMEAPVSHVPSGPPSTRPNSSMDEDEDMWGIVDEIEGEALNATSSAVEPAAPVALGPLPANHPADDDWEDMYA